MDIMNNMTVSTSKLTFSLIAIAALLIGGSAFTSQEAHATVPLFTAIHNSTTTTEVTFATAVNGTLKLSNWEVNGVVVTGATNGTTPSAANIVISGAGTLGFLNDTVTLKLTHQAIKTDDTFVVKYELNTANTGDLHDGAVGIHTVALRHNLANLTSTTGVDVIPPIPISAKTCKKSL